MATILEEVKAGAALSDIEARVTPFKMAHFVLRTKRVPELVDWYKKVFQADSVFDNGELAFLHFDGEHHRIAIGAFPDLEGPAPQASGIDHVAFSYSTLEELLYTYVRLKQSDIIPFFSVDHGPTTSFYYKDPDGNQVELQVDNFATLEDAHRYFKSSAFKENPIGVVVDPEDLVGKLEAGAAPADLLSYGTRSA